MNERNERQAARAAAEKPTPEDARQHLDRITAAATAARRHGTAALTLSFYDGVLQSIREQTDFAVR